MSNWNWFNSITRKMSKLAGMLIGATTVVAFIATFVAGMTFMCIAYEDEPKKAHNAFGLGYKVGSGKDYSEFKKEQDCAEKHIGF